MRFVGAYVVDGHLFFKMRDGSTVSCDCIGGPFASQIAAESDRAQRIESALKNCRNILRDGGHVYAKEIDKILE